jgi:hypothetical protein
MIIGRLRGDEPMTIEINRWMIDRQTGNMALGLRVGTWNSELVYPEAAGRDSLNTQS